MPRHEAHNKHDTGRAKSAPSGDRTTPPPPPDRGQRPAFDEKGFPIVLMGVHTSNVVDEKGFLSGNFSACGGPQTQCGWPQTMRGSGGRWHYRVG